MRIMCVYKENINLYPGITPGKTYELIKNDHDLYIINDNYGISNGYWSQYFVSLEEHRSKQLDKLDI